MRRPLKWTLWILGALVGLALLLGLAAVLILPSAWFRDKVRERMVTEIERASGGRTEIGAFRFDWKTLTAEVSPFVLHGTEPPSERPLFRAESVAVGIKIISMMKRDIDINAVVVDRPQVNILVDAEGKTNFPEPKIKRASTKNPVEQLVDLAIGRIELKDGWLQYADKKIPLSLRGENLKAILDYNLTGTSYRGGLSMSKLFIDSGKTLPIPFDLDTKVGLYKDHIQIENGQLTVGNSSVQFAGNIQGFKDPKLHFDVKADATLADLGAPLRLPRPHVGSVKFEGDVTYDARENLRIAGRAHGSGLAVHQGDVRIENIAVNSDVGLTTEKLELRGTRVNALSGTFAGMADIVDWKIFKVNGRVNGLSLATLSRIAGIKTTPYSALISGSVEVIGTIGSRDLKAGGKLALTPTEGGVPVSGDVEVAFNEKAGSVELGNSHLMLPSSRLDLSGTLGSMLKVRLESKELNDLIPALSIAGNPPEKLPISLLEGGSAVFDGVVNGPLKNASVTGALTLSNFEVQKEKVDRLVADVNATSSNVRVESFALGQGGLRLEGSADIALQNWKAEDTAPMKASVKLQGAQIPKLLASAGQKLPLEGLLNATAVVEGSLGNPRANLRINVEQPVIYGEKLDRIRAEIRYAGAGVEVINGIAELGTARILLAGAYEHPLGDYKNGRLRFDLATQGFALERVANVQKLRPGVMGRFEIKATGSTVVRNGALEPDKLDGLLQLRDLVVDGRPVGSFTLDAKTSGRQLNFGVIGDLRGSKVKGSGELQLAGDYQSRGSVEVSRIDFSTLLDLAAAAKGGDRLPVEGFLEGRLNFSGPVKKPELLRARLDLPVLQVVQSRKAGIVNQPQELSLRNAEPVVVEYDGKSVHVRSAHLVGRETDVRISGALNTKEKSPWDLRADGTLNLAILRDFNPDVISSGGATIAASVRGSIQDPQVTGSVELKNASFYMSDIPNGIDNANGVILFDRRRATIEKLTAETGGGSLTMGGFVGFGGPELSYRLTARATDVRVRYPEGVSTTVSSNLNLSGTSSKSILSGVVTIRRAGFNPKTDIGGVLASSARPVATPTTPNPFLRGMQLDIRIENAPNLQFHTALTSELQAEADLRVRGTAAKPTLLGRVVVNQGEVQFFGNKYTINRGEIGFYNPAKIEPVLDMDLETRVRGVLVTINFTGPLSKLNVSYRSDPPLQSNEIVALLAVGRAPGTNSSLASGQTVATQSFLTTGTNTLLGQAVAAPITGRLQRFFGVSRLKIDPQLSGINAVPQARLTIEQQLSRDLTLTYITNLSEANSQIVRLEWDINKSWSVVALREDNGAFGVDFLFKKRFK